MRTPGLLSPVGPQYPGGFSFARHVQPVLDRYCIDCHGLDDTAGELDLLGTIHATEIFPMACLDISRETARSIGAFARGDTR